MKNISRVFKLFTAKERKQLGLLTVAMIIMAVMEVIGVGAIGPFIGVAANPSMIQENPILSWIYGFLGIHEIRYFIAALGIVFFIVILTTNIFRTVLMYFLLRWSDMRSYTLSRRLLSQYLYQPYSFFLNRNSSELSKNILSEVQQVLRQVIRPGIELVARGLIALAILVFLVISSPVVALTVTLVLGGAYALVYGAIRVRLTRLGNNLRQYNKERFKSANEAFGAIKDVKILGKEPVFESIFAKASRNFAIQLANRQILTSLPQYIIEAVAIGLVVLLVVMLTLRGDEFATAIPLISVYAFAGFRLMPAFRTVFKNIGSLRSSGPIIDALYKDLYLNAKGNEQTRKEAVSLTKKQDRFPFNSEIMLNNICFTYPSASIPVINNLNITIKKNTTIGLIGSTGCGKTTLVDILLCLLEANGEIKVDGNSITKSNLRSWQQNFGYVPQHIFLADDTITNNIAFGIFPEQIQDERVKKAAIIAHLDDFINNELPEGYNTIVGERGGPFKRRPAPANWYCQSTVS